MSKSTRDSRGFTLIAAILMMLLLSALAVGVLYLVTNETRMGGNDLESNEAYYGAEAGLENLTAQLSVLYQNTQNPSAASITALTAPANYPTAISGSNITSMNYVESITWPSTQPNGTACPNPPNPCGGWDIVGSGQDQGMVATMIPYTLQVTATRASTAGEATNNSSLTPTGASVNLTRTIEVALLPAFEFGIFCDGDCDYFAGPPFNFGGRVHTNGNLFLAANTGPLTFTDKITAVGQVVTSQLENGQTAGSGSGSYNGSIYIPNASGGCPAAPNAGPGSGSNCVALPNGSWSGGFPPVAGSTTGNWTGISQTTFKGFIETGATGATKLQLPFVTSSKVGAIDIIRKPTPNDTTQIASARLYNEASIRILLADTEGDLYPGESRADGSTQDIQIGSPFADSANGSYVQVSAAPGVNSAGSMYFAMAQPQIPGTNNWTTAAPTNCTSATAASGTWPNWPLFGQVTVSGKQCQGAWLRVEYCPTGASCSTSPTSWVGITTQWLQYGFGRNYNQPPTHPYNSSTGTAPLCNNAPSSPSAQCQNGVSPAILILQQLQETVTVSSGGAMGSGTSYNWLPLNFYDAREGEPRDSRPSGDSGTNCSPVGIMNAVELDVGNLWLWLQGSGPYSGGSGKSVNAATYNGYILYFADHRGMMQDLYPLNGSSGFYNGFSGMSGLNDIVNSGSAPGVPDGKLEAMSYYATASPTAYSPEDTAVKGAAVNGGNVDKWGEANLGAGFGITAGNMAQPYYIYGSVITNAVQCLGYNSGTYTPYKSPHSPYTGIASAEWNMVTGPRHVLRLVDGGMDSAGNSFVPPTNGSLSANGNGFTIASEEPVYVWGNYNTGPKDPFWPSENTLTTPHSAASIMADAVTLLSNPPAGNNTQGGSAAATNVGYTDYETFAYPATVSSRPGNDSYYRLAIIAGKSIPFPNPSWSTEADFGTDGGMHNFLRYLEDRGASSAVVNYAGSMISMYYSQYATGNFKCCNSTYNAPHQRNYFFDTLFENPQNLPPGTPSFQDVVSLSYHQSFTPQ